MQDALANFIEILAEIPNALIIKRGKDLVRILQEKLKDAGSYFQIDSEKSFDMILVCNNACWAIGDIAGRVPEQIKPLLTDIINTLGDILNTEIISLISLKNDQLYKHFAKTISITLGKLGLIDA